MDSEAAIALVKLFRSHQEKIHSLSASVQAIQLVLARVTGVPIDEVQSQINDIAIQIRETEPDIQEREQLDALIAAIETGRTGTA